MREWWREALGRRPVWMNLLFFFCAYMAVVYVPYDFFLKPAAADVEVWLGLEFTGVWAKLTEPLRFAIYAAGAYGFWRVRPWLWPWASVYAAQVAVSMLVYNVVYTGGLGGVAAGVVSGGLFGALSLFLWRARDAFQRRERPRLRERYGEWALVTGASAGIGEAFARALAREGLSCVLVARRAERLERLAGELAKEHSVATRVVAADLSEPADRERLVEAVQDLEIAVLVNNAGVGYAGRFDKQDTERARRMVELNCTAPLVLTSRLLPAMRERRRGAVIFTGSVAASQPLPMHAVYSATKAFDRRFGESLWGELLGTGVDVLVLEPGPTESEFQQVAEEIPHPGEPPERVVEVALEALGRQPSVISGWWNYVRAQLAERVPPRSIVALVARRWMERQTPPTMR